MLHQFFTNLSAPFPYTRGLATESFSILKTCVLATLMLVLIKPFGLDTVPSTKILGFGIAVFVSAFFNVWMSLFLVRKFIDEEQWTVWKEVLRTFVYLSINILAILVFAKFSLDLSLDTTKIFQFIGFTILFAVIPISLRTISVKNWLLQKRMSEAQDLAQMMSENSPSLSHSQAIKLSSNIVNDTYSTDAEKLLFIEAEKNYITIVELIDGKLHKTLMRLSLVKAQEQIDNDSIVRCHRSYLVNIGKLVKVTGNSQGLKLFMGDKAGLVPVSRSYKTQVKHKINTIYSGLR